MNYDFASAVALTKDVFTGQYWDVDGRTNRHDFWHVASIVFPFLIIVGTVSGLVGLPILSTIFGAAVLAPMVGLFVRRVHDQNMVWWYGIIPFYNIYLATLPGDEGSNQFGDAPKPGTSQDAS